MQKVKNMGPTSVHHVGPVLCAFLLYGGPPGRGGNQHCIRHNVLETELFSALRRRKHQQADPVPAPDAVEVIIKAIHQHLQ